MSDVDLVGKDRLSSPYRSRSIKKAKEAANQFTLVARGLEGSGFGQASGI